MVDQQKKRIMISDPIPNELILEILLRLPTKSIARFHCVSKLWASMLSRPHFTELFLTRSSAQPRLFFAIEKNGLWSFFSLPQHLRSYEKSSSSLVVTAEFHMKFPPDNMTIYNRDDRRFSCGFASGLIYLYGMLTKEHYDGVPVICNPKTGHYATLPSLRRFRQAFSFLGFDPIDKQYKVLFMAYPCSPDHHKILTFGTGEMSWRRIKCSLRHSIASEGVCINGVLYYLGDTSECFMTGFVVVCFDVRSETFSFIYPGSYCELINYKGKLGLVFYDDYADDAIELRLWVLEDEERQEWSKYAHTLRDDKFLVHYVSIVGVTGTGEIVLSMADYISKQPFYVFYFNPERNIIQRVEIQGFGEYHEALGTRSRVYVFVDDVFGNDCSRFYAFANHVEDVNVIDSKLLKSNIYEDTYPKLEESDTSEDEETYFRSYNYLNKPYMYEEEEEEEEEGEGEGEDRADRWS
ncbi:F-box-like domain superfamily [Arabidopsis suecica]|uniref:F-box-like domain superfamily n=1 Tax=Arabidopsis suecica TaxID=45249 RepID=A0A8T2CN05_ARASU|nr:F-box-like domain superfamily [Arabidopsis suecica]